jgi:hypothetical protein
MSNRPPADPQTGQYKARCNDILAISSRIRYAGIANMFGRTQAGSLRKGLTALLKPDEARNEFFIEATRSQLRKNFERSIGKTEYTLTENEKVKILTIGTDHHFYYITIEKKTPPEEVMKIVEAARKLVMQ